MGISGQTYDRFSEDYTPNKDKRMADYHKKKALKRTENLAEKGKDEAARAAKAEDKPTIKKVTTVPISKDEDKTMLNAINNGLPGETLKKPRNRRKHFDSVQQPTLFDNL
jgi:hypothetical protein